MFQRKIYQDIEEILGFFPVLGIVGPRQVGKTTLAKEFAKYFEKETIYLDLENPRDLAKLSDPVFFFEANEDKCIILDEIQVRQDLFPIMRSMIDGNKVPARFILLGSASPILMGDSKETLAGRIHYEELTPLLWLEVSETIALQTLWLRGGYPDALLPASEKMSKHWRMSFISTYMQRDLPLLGLNGTPQQLYLLWQMICHFHGQLLNYESISRSLGITGPTVRHYIDFMENAFMIRLLRPYHYNTKKRLVKSPKIYIRDAGLLHTTLRLDTYNDLLGHPVVGASWEGFVIDQIISTLKEADFDYFFYRTHQGSEIDLVICKAMRPRIAVEIKFSSAPKISKGMILAMEDIGIKKGYVITPDSDTYKHSDEITICSLAHFLDIIYHEISK